MQTVSREEGRALSHAIRLACGRLVLQKIACSTLVACGRPHPLRSYPLVHCVLILLKPICDLWVRCRRAYQCVHLCGSKTSMSFRRMSTMCRTTVPTLCRCISFYPQVRRKRLLSVVLAPLRPSRTAPCCNSCMGVVSSPPRPACPPHPT